MFFRGKQSHCYMLLETRSPFLLFGGLWIQTTVCITSSVIVNHCIPNCVNVWSYAWSVWHNNYSPRSPASWLASLLITPESRDPCGGFSLESPSTAHPLIFHRNSDLVQGAAQRGLYNVYRPHSSPPQWNVRNLWWRAIWALLEAFSALDADFCELKSSVMISIERFRGKTSPLEEDKRS